MVPLELSKDNNQYCKISVFMPNAGSINESVMLQMLVETRSQSQCL